MSVIREALARASESELLPRGSSIVLAVSGGADSTALLYAAAELAPETGWLLSVGHVHHGWRERDADRDLAFVEEHSRRLGLPFAARRRDARGASRNFGLSPEAGARLVRYEALQAIAKEAGAARIATAHQEDDVLESHLLARRRRGGLALLAGPRESREDGVVRPLLGVSRADVLAFLSERGIAHRRDASNGDLRLLRNRVRRELAERTSEERRELAYEVARLRTRLAAVERAVFDAVLPHVRSADGSLRVPSAVLAGAAEEVARAALERLAAPFARPGRPPFTGREREQILRRLACGGDFRFEAGRRIRFEKRGPELRVGYSEVYDSRIETLNSRAEGAA